MRDMSIKEFCKLHGACSSGRNWALTNCKTMKECWKKLPNDYLVWVATRDGVLSHIQLVNFSLFCCKQVSHLMTDERSKAVIETLERFLNGKVSEKKLYETYKAAIDAARAAADAADATYAARAAYMAADVARGASDVHDVAHCAARAAADAAYAAQANWLRENIVPNFKKSLTPSNSAV